MSVVLPTHDRPGRVGAALGSVLAQTYANLEVLVVDDASRSPSSVEAAVVRATGNDDRVRMIRLPTSRGAAGARNEGLRHLTGELVAFIDDDDLWEPAKVARQVTFLEDNPHVGTVSCDHLIVVEDERGTPGAGSPERRVRSVAHFRGPASYSSEQLLWVNFVGSFSFVMVRRSVVGEDLWVDERFECAEDWDLWLRCARVAPTGRVCAPLVRYVSHRHPRLTDPSVKRRGLETFESKHAAAMSPPCRAFHQAHQQMDTGTGWVKRAHVLGALARPSRASRLLLAEQAARQLGRLTGDPGLAERVIAKSTRRL